MGGVSGSQLTQFLTSGCQFTGGRLEITSHKDLCQFRDESQLIAVTMKEVSGDHQT